MLTRGFIGPIGDDLPSLIPLLLGLVIFFSTFSLTFNAFEDRNAGFRDDLAVMGIARVMQSNSYIFSFDNFLELCNRVGSVNLKYVAAITPDAVEGKNVMDIFGISFFSDTEGNVFYCSNVPEPGARVISDFISENESQDAKLVSRIFPIVVEDERIVKPLHLVVVAWK